MKVDVCAYVLRDSVVECGEDVLVPQLGNDDTELRPDNANSNHSTNPLNLTMQRLCASVAKLCA